MSKIAVFVGSLRKESFNRRLAHALARLAPQGLELGFPRIDDLPPFNQDDEANPAPMVRRLKGEVLAADGVIFVTPEYNRSVPGVLKNAIDHASRPYGESAWQGKPAAVIGMSPGAIGTAVAQMHLRTILACLDMPTLGQPEMYLTYKEGFFDADGNVGEKSREQVRKWLDRYGKWVEGHAREAAGERKAA
jgi:chromate reductase